MGTAQPVALTGADQQVRTGQGVYAGYAIEETAGATAKVRIYDGTTAAGTLLDIVSLAANGASDSYVDVRFAVGIFVKVVSGTVAGSVRIG